MAATRITRTVSVTRDADGWLARCTESDESGPILGRIAMDEPLDAETAEEAVFAAAAHWSVDPADVVVS